MRKVAGLLLLCFLVSFALFADSFTFSTAINGISNGLNGFGIGMLPLGTNFSFETYFPLIKNYKHNAEFKSEFEFSFSDNWIPEWYSYDRGVPRWYLKESEVDWTKYIGGHYFNPRSYMHFFLQQGFGTNPVSESGPLVYVRAAWNTRYSMALEYNGVLDNSYSSTVFVNPDGSSKAPFGLGSVLPGMPWLQDNHIAWNNYLQLATYWYLYKDTAHDSRDGAYAELIFEYGPSWLGNTVTPKGITSDFWRVYGYLDERLTLFSIKQNDGKNWMNMYVGHSNYASYVGGDVVPEHKIPGDRLRASAGDRIWLHFSGPQFIAGDCYSYIELALNNNIYWGHVVNEVAQSTVASELLSSISGTFHLRLFGFIRFEYNFGYDFNRGIWQWNPGWWQNAEVRFYVSV